MKIAVVSDTHHRTKSIIKKLKDIKGLDLIIHLGDMVKDAYKIEKELSLEVIKVKGNCDYNVSDEKEEMLLNYKKRKLFITHGHKYNIKYDFNRLYFKAKEVGADVVIFGHTHVPTSEIIEDIIFFNPGSTTIPRSQKGKTFGIIEINDTVETNIYNL
jgi:hypothetical protein